MSGDTLPFPGGDVPRPFGVPERSKTDEEQRIAGPESAAEHLRNALQLLDALRLPPSADWYDDVLAVRRRVAAALAQLEGK